MKLYFILSGSVLAAGLLIGASCDKKTFSTDSTYAEEIESFITDSDNGKELFSQEIYARGPFSIDDTDVKYLLTIDSVKRKIKVLIGSAPKDVPPYDGVYDASARVDDDYFGRLTRIVGTGLELSYIFKSHIVRHGYFLKLYGDAYEYRGWRFWGFNGANAARRIEASSGNTFVVGALIRFDVNASPTQLLNLANYLPVDNIPNYPFNDSLTLISSSRDVVSVRNAQDSLIAIECQMQGGSYRAGWKLAGATNRYYHLLTFQTPGNLMVDSTLSPPETTLVKTMDFLIPISVGN
ncbi:MAG: hypothetical protein HRF51_03720 [bacterium]|jgi:hypothetical protein